MKPLALSPQRILLLGIAWALAASMLIAGGALAATEQSKLRYVPNEYIIHVKAGTSTANVQAMVDRLGASVVKRLPLNDTYLIRVGRSGSKQSGASGYRVASAVKWTIDRIQPNYYSYACAIPNDPYWDYQWGMNMIHAPAAWDIEKGSDVVTVAVVDSGVAEHPEFGSRLLDGIDLIDTDNPNGHSDGLGHGTHVAGIIAAQGNNAMGVTGVCWDKVKILPVRVFDNEGGGATTDVMMAAYTYVLASDAQVVNLSLGSPGDDPALHGLIKSLVENHKVVVAASGNDKPSEPAYPAFYPEVITVSAVGPDERLTAYSKYGKVDIAAPGGVLRYEDDWAGILSTWVTWSTATPPVPTFGYALEQGTSMACPHVSGAAALLISHNLAPDAVKDRLKSTARTPSSGIKDESRYGKGILDLYAALSSASVRIASPTAGSTVLGNPDFRINFKGIEPTSIKVYLDYADSDSDGVPNAGDEGAVIINQLNIGSYISPGNTSLGFSWPLPARNALSPGVHRLYVSGLAIIDGRLHSDWCTFYVGTQVIKAGLHLFAFPYSFATNDPMFHTVSISKMPSALFTEAASANPILFRDDVVGSATLMRWLPKTSVGRTTPYFQHLDNKFGSLTAPTLADKLAWYMPVDSARDADNVSYNYFTGGGFAMSDPDSFKFPAGSGFWMFLPRDARLNEVDSSNLVSTNDPFSIYLYEGWNMIGNPFNKEVPWGTVLFTYRGVGPKTLTEAVDAGWIKLPLFEYSSELGRYVNVGATDLLKPFNGYWLRALVGGSEPNRQLVLTVIP